MICNILWHIIWVSTVCQSTHLGLSGTHRVILLLWLIQEGLLSVTSEKNRERSGSVVECLTRDRGVTGSSLTGVTAL